jgi:hypothetical protein
MQIVVDRTGLGHRNKKKTEKFSEFWHNSLTSAFSTDFFFQQL